MFKLNVGTADRIIRVLVGAVMLALFFIFPDAPWRLWMLIGVVLLITGIVQVCPLYMPFGLSTRPSAKR